MQSIQSISGYHIPTAFVKQFSLDKTILDYEVHFLISKSTKRNGYPFIQEYTHLKTLLESIRFLTSSGLKPEVEKIITKLDSALKDYVEILRASDVKDLSNVPNSTRKLIVWNSGRSKRPFQL